MTIVEPREIESTEKEQHSSEGQLSQETPEESSGVQEDPWIRKVTAGESIAEATPEQSCNQRGPTYKVDLVVDGVKQEGFWTMGHKFL